MVAALIAILGDLAVGLGVQVFRLYCGNVTHITRNMRPCGMIRSFAFLSLVGGSIAHVPDDGTLLRPAFQHEVIKYRPYLSISHLSISFTIHTTHIDI